MSPELKQSLLSLLAMVTVASAIGGFTYFLCRKVRPTPIFFGLALLFYLISISTVGQFGYGFSLLLPIALSSVIGTWVHRKTIEIDELDWYSPYQLVIPTAILISLAIIALLAFSLGPAFVFSLGRNLSPRIRACLMVAVISPSLTPFFILAWRNMKLQPGVDKHLES